MLDLPNEPKNYDLVINGGVPAGIHTGTVPSKRLRETALALSGRPEVSVIGESDESAKKKRASTPDYPK